MSTPNDKPSTSAPLSLSELAARRAEERANAPPLPPASSPSPSLESEREEKEEGWRPVKTSPPSELPKKWESDFSQPSGSLLDSVEKRPSVAPLNSQARSEGEFKPGNPLASSKPEAKWAAGSPETVRIKQKLAALSEEYLVNGIKLLFSQADDTLFKFAEQAGGQDNQEFILGFKSLRQQHIAVEKSFQDSIRKCWFPEKASPIAEKNLFASLSLVNDEELEESLAESMVVAQINKAIAPETSSLLRRLAILEHSDGETKEIPISPEVLSEAFKQAMRPVADLPITVKMIVFKLFDRHVLTVLPELLAKLNEVLAQAGILPNIKPTVLHSGSSGGVQQSSPHVVGPESAPSESYSAAPMGHQSVPGVAPSGPYPAGSYPVSYAPHGFIPAPMGSSSETHAGFVPPLSFTDRGAPINWGAVQSLLATHRAPPPLVKGNLGQLVPAPVVPLQDLMAVIAQLHQNGVREEGPYPGEVKHVLKEALVQQHPGHTALHLGDHEDAIDMIDLLFEFILKDSDLPSAIQALLARLQMPYLRMAVLEPQLFSDEDHPARQLLNHLSEAGKTWSESSDVKGDLKNLMDDIVRRVLENSDQGAPLFKNLLIEFDQKWHQMKERAKIVERRISEAAMGKERLEHARKLSAQAIVDQLAGVVLPDKLRMAIHRPWAYYMTMCALKEGDESQAFHQTVELLKRVAEFSRLTPSPRGNAHRKTEINMLLEQWGKGLQVAGLFDEEINSWKNVLESFCYERMGLDIVSPSAPNAFRPLPHEDVAATATESALPNQEVNVNFLDQVNQLKSGQWVEWRLAGGYDGIRAKLAWVGGFTGKLLFVDHRGLKSVETHKQILARELEQGEAILLSEEPLMDQALNSIGKKLSVSDL